LAVGSYDPRHLVEFAGPYQIQRVSRKKRLRVAERLVLRARSEYPVMCKEWFLPKQEPQSVKKTRRNATAL
jgi:hypothetical protein